MTLRISHPYAFPFIPYLFDRTKKKEERNENLALQGIKGCFFSYFADVVIEMHPGRCLSLAVYEKQGGCEADV